MNWKNKTNTFLEIIPNNKNNNISSSNINCKNALNKQESAIYKTVFKEISKIILHVGGLLLRKVLVFLLFVINKIIQLEVILKIVMFSRFPSDRKNEVILLKDRCCLIFCCFWMFWSYIFSLIFFFFNIWTSVSSRCLTGETSEFCNGEGVFSENFEF